MGCFSISFLLYRLSMGRVLDSLQELLLPPLKFIVVSLHVRCRQVNSFFYWPFFYCLFQTVLILLILVCDMPHPKIVFRMNFKLFLFLFVERRTHGVHGRRIFYRSMGLFELNFDRILVVIKMLVFWASS